MLAKSNLLLLQGYFYYGGSEVVGMTGVNPKMEHVKMNDSHTRVKRWDFMDFDSSKGSSDVSTKPGSEGNCNSIRILVTMYSKFKY